jgi:hypothetical protein
VHPIALRPGRIAVVIARVRAATVKAAGRMPLDPLAAPAVRAAAAVAALDLMHAALAAEEACVVPLVRMARLPAVRPKLAEQWAPRVASTISSSASNASSIRCCVN